jgi:hypothetical protein
VPITEMSGLSGLNEDSTTMIIEEANVTVKRNIKSKFLNVPDTNLEIKMTVGSVYQE